MSGSIVAIQTCPGHHRPMKPLEETDLVAGGIPGDAHFSPRSTRQLLMIEQETLDELGLKAGQVKENLTLAKVPLARLAAGTRLRMGRVELEVTKPCAPCARMDEIRHGLRRELAGRRGTFARVIRAGRVRRGDPVSVLDPSQRTAP